MKRNSQSGFTFVELMAVVAIMGILVTLIMPNVKHYTARAKVAEAIVALTGAQAGCVTSGAAASLFLGTCAILAGDELAWMDALPDTQGRPNEFVVHRTHRSP